MSIASPRSLGDDGQPLIDYNLRRFYGDYFGGVAQASKFNGQLWVPPPNGVDDTAGMDSAFAQAAGARINFWPGTYFYTGAGWNGTDYNLRGAGDNSTLVNLVGATGGYLIDTTQPVGGLDIEGFQFVGGKGVFHSTHVGGQGDVPMRVSKCYTWGYTACAFGHNNPNFPFWRFTKCQFKGSTTSIAVALAGLTSGSSFEDVVFFWDGIAHVKLAQNGIETNFERCTFMQQGGGAGNLFRAAIWVIPATSDSASATGMRVGKCDFGSEQLDPSDYRILYADEIAGPDFTTNLPQLAADSAGYIQGHIIRDSAALGGSVAPVPLIYSTTPNLYGVKVGDIQIHSNGPSYICQFRTPPVAGFDGLNRYTNRNIAGPFYWTDQTTDAASQLMPQVSNAKGMFYLIDPTGIFQDDAGAGYFQYPGGSDFAAFVALYKGKAGNLTLGGGMTTAAITDADGKDDARELTATGAGSTSYAAIQAASIVPGAPVWIEFDLRLGSAAPLPTLQIFLTDVIGAEYLWRRYLTLPATWQRYRFMVPGARGVPASARLFFQVPGAGTFGVGRIRVYHAREPIPYAQQVHIAPSEGISALADAATVVTDPTLGTYYTLTAAASPRTMGQPLVGGGVQNYIGKRITYDILNGTGGALVTAWNAIFKFTNGAWVDPANGKRRKIQFTFEGTNYVEDWRSTVDF